MGWERTGEGQQRGRREKEGMIKCSWVKGRAGILWEGRRIREREKGV